MAQVTISIIVLICAGLFVRSLRKVLETDPGFRTEKMVTMMINPRLLGYDQKAIWRFFPELIHRIETQPGVRMAALTDDLPLSCCLRPRCWPVWSPRAGQPGSIRSWPYGRSEVPDQ